MSRAYYNEIDPYAAAWLRSLMAAGLIMEGDVDERSIVDIRAQDLRGYTQCHFFAGIAGWSLALGLAGWAADRPVWTGSCPCQPFSVAGKHEGENDPRHLWPQFYRLIGQCRPPVVFGEQVAGPDGLRWLDGVFADLEGSGYACGAADLCAAGVGAPHIRQRLYWVAYTQHLRFDAPCPGNGRAEEGQGSPSGPLTAGCGEPGRLADGEPHGREESEAQSAPAGQQGIRQPVESCTPDRLAYSDLRSRGQSGGYDAQQRRAHDAEQAGVGCGSGGLGDPAASGHQGHRPEALQGGDQQQPAQSGPWSDFVLVPCQDERYRRISAQPADVPLAHGIPTRRADLRLGYMLSRLRELGYDTRAARRILREARGNRVGRLKGYGNAIVPPLAAEFVRAAMQTQGGF